MAEYEKQHYVPQSYLRRFSPDRKHVHVLDKPTGTVEFWKIEGLAQRRYFDEAFLRDETGSYPPGVAPGVLERELGRWETALSEMTKVTQRVADGGGASLEERHTMSICMAVQLTRTRTFRQLLVQGVTGSLEEEMNEYLRQVAPDVAKHVRGTLTFREQGHSALHTDFLWRSGWIPRIATDIFHYIWRVGITLPFIPLCTSDSPVVVAMHDHEYVRGTGTGSVDRDEGPDDWRDAVRRILGILDAPPAIELVFPLTPTLALLAYHPVHFAEMYPLQGKRKILHPAEVLHYNALQVLYAERQAYSERNIFPLVTSLAAHYRQV